MKDDTFDEFTILPVGKCTPAVTIGNDEVEVVGDEEPWVEDVAAVEDDDEDDDDDEWFIGSHAEEKLNPSVKVRYASWTLCSSRARRVIE